MALRRWHNFRGSTTTRLALSYLLIIMLMSIGFSLVFYKASSHELGRQLPPPGRYGVSDQNNDFLHDNDLDQFLRTRIEEGRRTLMLRLVALNASALVAGSAFSYYLARRTLRPIEANMGAQAQFVSDASHELRTPLTAMQTMNEVALRRPKLTLTDAKGVIEQNLVDVRNLHALTDSLLALARQENVAPTFAPVSLQDVVAEAMNRVVSIAQAKSIAIQDGVPIVMTKGDRQSLVQALVVVLDNAIKYSPAGSTIKLEGGQAGKHAYVSVHDSGQGIKPADLAHVFDRFYRADQSRNQQQSAGYGIGLSLAKKIVHQHHGEIVATSTYGKGSTFTIQLPIA